MSAATQKAQLAPENVAANPSTVRQRISAANISDGKKKVLNDLLDEMIDQFHFSEEQASAWIASRIETAEELVPELQDQESKREIDAVFSGKQP